ncbi:MAG: hypothetical protein LBS19_11300, partial [Clostridiales bacterium]|nr:hypothetical protein [Clostridiales bacterium]
MSIYDIITDRSGVASAKWAMRTDEMKRRGLMPFSVADMEIRTAPEIIDALTEAAGMGIYGYTMDDGEYRAAVAGWFKRRHNYTFRESDIICTGGVVQGLYGLVREFTKP